MCGINGLIVKSKLPETESDNIKSLLRQMNNRIIHRGPDDDGEYIFNSMLAMGMRRLSIIDLSQGKQPIYNDDKSLVITFNGEIYNFIALREGLVQQGVNFKTHSDTEVILRLYERYGKECVSMLNGMFAFSIHDVKSGKVFIARDRFGEKPLYYVRNGNEFFWASELKSIVNIRPEFKKISRQALNLYFSLTYIPAPYSIYDNIFKLQAGHYMEVDVDTLEYAITKYWDIDLTDRDGDSISYDVAKKRIRELMFDSVEKRMIADVPLGVFLSGGVDSTIVAAIMSKVSSQKVKTFSVGYSNKRYDESERAKWVAGHIQSEHHQFLLDYTQVLNVLDKIILNYDEPFADSSCLPTYFVSSKTVQHVKVALTGDGGDEVFGGYNKYLIHTYGNVYKKIIPGFVTKGLVKPVLNSSLFGSKDSKSFLSKASKMIDSLSEGTVNNQLNIITLGFKAESLRKLLKQDVLLEHRNLFLNIEIPEDDYYDPVKLARYIDKNTSLEGDMLVKVDRASMLCSLECRAPFLDHRIMELTYKIPDNYLIQGSNKKRILKDTFEDLLPDNFFNSPKSGFEIPISYWLKNELKSDLLSTLSIANMEKHGLFHNDFVIELISEHLDGKTDHSYKLWTLFSFQKWYNNQIA